MAPYVGIASILISDRASFLVRKMVSKKAFLEGLTVRELRRLAKEYGARGQLKADLVDSLKKKTRGVPVEELKAKL